MFRGPGTPASWQRPNFDGCIFIRYAAPPYSARISAIYLLPFRKKFGWVPFADVRVQRLATKHK